MKKQKRITDACGIACGCSEAETTRDESVVVYCCCGLTLELNRSTMAETNDPSSLVVPEDPRTEILSFAVALPAESMRGLDEPSVRTGVELMGGHGVVGTIVVLKKSIMIWLGWGNLQQGTGSATTVNQSRLVGGGT
jgi:hypothetical protein